MAPKMGGATCPPGSVECCRRRWPDWIYPLRGPLSFAWAALTGMSATVQLILLLSLPPLLMQGQGIARLTAGMTFIGYGLAFLMPLIGGMIADATGLMNLALAPACVLAVTILGIIGPASLYQPNPRGQRRITRPDKRPARPAYIPYG